MAYEIFVGMIPWKSSKRGQMGCVEKLKCVATKICLMIATMYTWGNRDNFAVKICLVLPSREGFRQLKQLSSLFSSSMDHDHVRAAREYQQPLCCQVCSPSIKSHEFQLITIKIRCSVTWIDITPSTSIHSPAECCGFKSRLWSNPDKKLKVRKICSFFLSPCGAEA